MYRWYQITENYTLSLVNYQCALLTSSRGLHSYMYSYSTIRLLVLLYTERKKNFRPNILKYMLKCIIVMLCNSCTVRKYLEYLTVYFHKKRREYVSGKALINTLVLYSRPHAQYSTTSNRKLLFNKIKVFRILIL